MQENPYAAPKATETSAGESTGGRGWTPRRVALITWSLFRRQWRGYLGASFTILLLLALMLFLFRTTLNAVASGLAPNPETHSFWTALLAQFAPLVFPAMVLTFAVRGFIHIGLIGVRGNEVNAWQVFQGRGFFSVLGIGVIGFLLTAPLFTLLSLQLVHLLPTDSTGTVDPTDPTFQFVAVLEHLVCLPLLVPHVLAMFFVADGRARVGGALLEGWKALWAAPGRILLSTLGTYALWWVGVLTRVGTLAIIPLVVIYWSVIYLLAEGGELRVARPASE